MPFQIISRRAAALAHAISRSGRRGIAGTALAAALLLPAASAHAATYENPFTGDTVFVGRTDMGVDLCLATGAPIRAVGAGVVAGVMHNWFEHEPYIWYELTSGPDAGRYVYVAEQINHLAAVGQTLRPGDIIARYARKGTCIETGWSEPNGETTAAATTGYAEGEVTSAGISFAHFLVSVGVPGQFELTAPKSQIAKSKSRRRKKRKAVVPVSKPVAPKQTSTGSTSGATAIAPVTAPAPGTTTAGGSPTSGSGETGSAGGGSPWWNQPATPFAG
jgi:hypothetical protein